MSELGEVGAAYRGVRQRVGDLVKAGPSLDVVVPACPDWQAHNLVSHMAGVVADFSAGKLDGAGSDEWTAAQVDARRSLATADVLAEWAMLSPEVESMLDQFGPPGRQTVMDAVTHEHDLRGAIGEPGARDSDAVSIGLDWLAKVATRLAPIRIRSTDGGEWSPKEGEPAATVSGDPFDLLRAFSGRRTEAELRELDWEGDIDAAIPAAFTFGPFSIRTESLGE